MITNPKEWMLLGTITLLGCAASWSTQWVKLSQETPTVLQTDGDVTAAGANLHDSRILTFTLDIPADINRVGLRTTSLNNAHEGDLEVSIISALDNSVLWSRVLPVSELRSDSTYLTGLDGRLKAGTYTVQMQTEGVSSAKSLQIPISVLEDTPNETFRVYEVKESVQRLITERSGSVWIQFTNYESVGLRALRATQKSLLPFAVIMFIGITYGIFRQRRSIYLTFQKGVASDLSQAEWLLFIILGFGLAYAITAPIYVPLNSISAHGDINRGLIFYATAREQLIDGRLPLWQPYMCGGAPLWGDIEQWLFQPLAILTLPFSAPVALKLSYTAALALSFIGFGVLAKTSLRLNTLGAIVFAFLVSFTAYLSQHLAEGYVVWIGAAWVPWFILFTLKSFTRPAFIPVAGLMAAWIFGSGTMHLVFYSAMFLTIIAATISYKKRVIHPLTTLALVLLFAVILGAVKLLPVLDQLDIQSSRLGLVPSLSLLPDMLLTRKHLPALEQDGINYRWSEFANYMGVIPFLLALTGGIMVWTRRKLLPAPSLYGGTLLASLVLLVLVFTHIPATDGLFASVVDLLRMPSRLMIFPVIGISLLAAYAAQVLWQRTQRIRWGRTVRLGLGIILLIAAVDLVMYDLQLFSQKFTLPLPAVARSEQFQRTSASYTKKDVLDGKYYKVGYISYLENMGTNDLCRHYQPDPHTRAFDSSDPLKPYNGEVWLVNGGKILEYSLKPGILTIAATTSTKDRIVLNQNYDAGWKSTGDIQPESFNGLVSVPISEGTQTLVLEYQPQIMWWGAWITVLGSIIAIMWYGLLRKLIW